MKKAEQIKKLLKEGKKYQEISIATDAALSTIAYHAQKMGLRKFTFSKQKYDWKEIQKYADEGYCIVEIIEKFKMNWSTFRDARLKSLITLPTKRRTRKVPKPFSRSGIVYSDDFLFSENCPIGFGVVKRRFKYLVPPACSNNKCPIYNMQNPQWAGIPITLHIDHINGIRTDNRMTNLRWLCPNCHSQTDTYCGRKLKK